ncbi:unnamed protein product [Effrenium voratum]|uniref:Replication factor Mcm10 C-terminal domain-containing protein n=1 Tax=Effrenium voratum TaxID=2562239 RepID=A0AA36IWF5_9DINO|nr:unnamed protein product [Effrenium voratum]CAJ1454715.1 unnamed protein product [Effrenium voratum]
MPPEDGKDEVQKEKYSGLRLTGRTISARRWDELMTGKRYTSFSSLPNADTQKAVVAIGVLYEKAAPKTGSTGSRFGQWSFTDLALPQPRLLKLLLFGEAFEAWDADKEKTVHYGAVFGILNPVAMTGSQSDTLVSAKVTHSTQLVLLGQCPSLGFCSMRKKDGLPCTMPCNKDQTGGALVCFYHTMHQEAQKVKKWASLKAGAGKAETPGLVVRQPSQVPVRAPVVNTGSPKVDPALQRLLKGPSPRKQPQRSQEKMRPKTAPPAAPPAAQAPQTSQGSWRPQGSQQTQGSQGSQGLRTVPAPQGEVSAAERKILAMFPDGLPAPDPNQPMESRLRLAGLASKAKGDDDLAAMPTPQQVPRFRTASKRVASPNRGLAKEVRTEAPKQKGSKANFHKLESEFGRKCATLLAQSTDPRKDLVRQQSSRFQSVVEEQRAAKRMRRLTELEALDAAQEQMEELKVIQVRAFRCRSCFKTYDSERQRISCQEQGHEVATVEAKKSRWECKACHFSEEVLDRQLPPFCQRCRGDTWKQVSLRKTRRMAPMERDMFLARGEELPFINSVHIPELQGTRYQAPREAQDDYAGL